MPPPGHPLPPAPPLTTCPRGTPAARPHQPAHHPRYKVGAEHEELALRKDDLVTDLTKLNDGWYFGTNQRNGAMGMLPANFVKLNHLLLQDHVAM